MARYVLDLALANLIEVTEIHKAKLRMTSLIYAYEVIRA